MNHVLENGGRAEVIAELRARSSRLRESSSPPVLVLSAVAEMRFAACSIAADDAADAVDSLHRAVESLGRAAVGPEATAVVLGEIEYLSTLITDLGTRP